MMIINPPLFCSDICGRNNIIGGLYNILEGLILKSSLCNQGHIPCCCIVIVIIESVCVDEMGVFTSQLLSPFIHHIYESLYCTSDIFRYSGRNLIGRTEKDTVKALFHGQSLSRLDADMSASRLDIIHLIGESDLCIQRYFFNGKHSCHDLGDAGRSSFFVNSFCVQDLPAVQIHDNACFGYDLGTLGPARDFVGLDFPFIAFRHCGFLGSGICCCIFLCGLFCLGVFAGRNGCQGTGCL